MNRRIAAAADLSWNPGPGFQRVLFFGSMALLFASSTVATMTWGLVMAQEMGEIPMPGGWMLSMAWMPMCERTWAGAAASFLGMWMVMMTAMMLPSLAPVLWRYHQAIGGAYVALIGLGYFAVWALLGMAIFPLGAALAEAMQHLPEMARAAPMASGMVVLAAGALQFCPWKAHHLACCRLTPRRRLPADAGAALRHGLRLGWHCCQSCAGLTAILLVVGVMELRAMAVVAAAVSVERLAPAGQRIAQAVGLVIVGGGLLLLARAAGLG